MNPFDPKRFMQLFDPVDHRAQNGGDDRDRTGDPLLAKQVLSQLSYIPSAFNLTSQSAPLDGGPNWIRTSDLTLIRGAL
jgi:hypothetical protein